MRSGIGSIHYKPDSNWKVGITAAQSERCEARLEGRVIRFRPGEYRVLLALAMSPPERALTVHDIIERCWPDPDSEPDWSESTVKIYIGHLRRLGVPIQTDRGRGYLIPAENRSLYTSRRVISTASAHCVSLKSSRNNRRGAAGDYRNRRA
jgi:DNA-binding response OmpR family regulator